MNYNGIELGPIMKEDALLLQAIIKLTNPRKILELGFFYGESAKKMLEVMDGDSKLISFDNTKNGNIDDPRFIFYRKSQEELDGIYDIDFCFIDASHEIKLNKKTFEKLKDIMTDGGIIAVHDTGAWLGGNVFEIKKGKLDDNGNWVHCPDEQEFVNWIKETYPEWQQIHFHSKRQVRHGMTLLQKYKKL